MRAQPIGRQPLGEDVPGFLGHAEIIPAVPGPTVAHRCPNPTLRSPIAPSFEYASLVARARKTALMPNAGFDGGHRQ